MRSHCCVLQALLGQEEHDPANKTSPTITSSHFLYHCVLLIVQFWYLCKVCVVVHKKNSDPLPLEQNLLRGSHLCHQVCQSTRMASACHLHPLHSAPQHNPATPEMRAPINYQNATNATLSSTDKLRSHI